MFEQTKHPLLSRGIIGGLIALAVGLLQFLGYAVSPADIADLKDLAVGIIASCAGMLSIVGRIHATKRISLGG